MLCFFGRRTISPLISYSFNSRFNQTIPKISRNLSLQIFDKRLFSTTFCHEFQGLGKGRKKGLSPQKYTKIYSSMLKSGPLVWIDCEVSITHTV